MSHPDFQAQPELASDVLHLRPLRPGDFDGLHAAARDPDVWAGHPVKNRFVKDVFEGYFRFLLESGSTLVVLDRKSGTIIGCSRYYIPPDRPDGIAIGFTFLSNAYWGGRTNFELKRLMLDHAFQAFSEVWFHIDPTNLRSQKATAKFGAEHVCDASLDLAGAPASWMCFRLTREAWNGVLAGRAERGSGGADESLP